MTNKITQKIIKEYYVNGVAIKTLDEAIQLKKELDVRDFYNETDKLHVSMGCVEARDFADLIMEYKNELLEILLQGERIQIGTTDRNGKQVYVGDYLDFGANEWGDDELEMKPERVPPLSEFVKGFPLSGCFDDIAQYRAIVEPPK